VSRLSYFIPILTDFLKVILFSNAAQSILFSVNFRRRCATVEAASVFRFCVHVAEGFAGDGSDFHFLVAGCRSERTE